MYTHTYTYNITHTRQEWIIIWSGRNWILKHANQPRSLDIKRVAFGVLSLAPCYIWKKAGTSSWRPRMISHFSTGVFVGLSPVEKPQAPCLRIKFLKLGWRRERTEGKKREVLHLCRCYTHTPGRSRVNPERQEEEKSGHTKGKRPKQRRGGRGTDGPQEPTYTEKRTWPKTAHTPKPHDTLRRGTQGELGTKWGTSWRQTREPKQLFKQQDSVPKPRSRALCHSRPVVSSCPNWHKTAYRFQRIRCTTCFTSPETKETTPAGKGHACSLHLLMSCVRSKAEAAGKTEFLTVQNDCTR